ncbi:ABC transporter ATP-binding protein [Lactobacillus sp. M0403]|uniref:ABC transporter ATP-binding protein n=1 Tax=unclassified Lactobacillus TaxID=2620435 RepID=UPI0018DCACA7|nr:MULTISPECIES: ABC transporter ATP-binding protein [unclassified Lactobacillus]MBH9985830.1 ABC transporter ATP-binding protein [Lactobacillus sp. M0390]MBI0092184.1 ABC transporter ATP-binding protein [Lactobacillus sp. M0403]
MLIETQELTKKFGDKIAVNKANIQIKRGQLVAYLGTNGAGKSTTINMLTGLLKPTSGIISKASNLKIGVVFQNSVLDNALTVKDNLYLRAQMYRNYSPDWLEHLIALMDIKEFSNQKFGTLSGGQKRRVDIARALICKPDLLFLDEPTTGLDIQTRIVIWNLLTKLQQQQNLTIFLTTHYLEEAENADQMYILENGQILASGSAAEIKTEFAPNKLILTVNDTEILQAKQKVIQFSHNQVEIDSLSPQEAIGILKTNQENITDFSYRKGTINDAFLQITGKEIH